MLQSGNIPIRFIESIEAKQHLMLLYDDKEHARLMEFIFMKSGLERGESCIYATHENSADIVIKMLTYGIPLEAFVSKKIRVISLKITSKKKEEIITECKKEILRIQEGLRRPYRIIARMVPDVTTHDGIIAEIELEKLTHQCFEDFGGTIMCPYDMSAIEKTMRLEWIKELYSNHHSVIYIPKYGEGGVICPVTPQIEAI